MAHDIKNGRARPLTTAGLVLLSALAGAIASAPVMSRAALAQDAVPTAPKEDRLPILSLYMCLFAQSADRSACGSGERNAGHQFAYTAVHTDRDSRTTVLERIPYTETPVALNAPAVSPSAVSDEPVRAQFSYGAEPR